MTFWMRRAFWLNVFHYFLKSWFKALYRNYLWIWFQVNFVSKLASKGYHTLKKKKKDFSRTWVAPNRTGTMFVVLTKSKVSLSYTKIFVEMFLVKYPSPWLNFLFFSKLIRRCPIFHEWVHTPLIQSFRKFKTRF